MIKKKWIMGAIILGIGLLLFLPVYKVMELNDEEDNVLFTFKWSSDELKIGWIHSVELTPWVETYRITSNNELSFVETRFQSYGAGTPDTDGEVEFSESGFMRVTDIQREIPYFSLYYVPISNYYIEDNQKKYYLEYYVDDYSSVNIKPSRVSLLKLIKKYIKTEGGF